jgi:hypothetical protein
VISPTLKRQLSQHFQEQGRFSPFVYAVGLESSYREAEEAMQDYPIRQPMSEETFEQFKRSLTFFHEIGHLGQFLSSAFGLRTLRFTIICLRNLSRKPGWKLPIAEDLWSRIELSPHEFTAAEGCLNFLDAMDQLRLQQASATFRTLDFETLEWKAEVPNGSGMSVRLDWEPRSPHFLLNDATELTAAEKADVWKKRGAHIRRQPVLTITVLTGSSTIVINAAVLMEAFAALVEINHIGNALGSSAFELFELLPTGNEYFAVLAYLLESGLCTSNNLFPTLAICIDAALMYDPFVLYDVPWDTADAQGRTDHYPGETFITVCEALRRTEPLRSNAPEEMSRFYNDLCQNAGLPSPAWMANKAFEVADKLMSQKPWEQTLLGRALKAHHTALDIRRKSEPGAFVAQMPTTGGLYELTKASLPAVSFYNLNTRQADHFDPRKVDGLTIHSILQQALTAERIDCPLKMGHPFFCPSATKPLDQLCTWNFAGGASECLVDILEQQLKLMGDSS